MSEPLRRAGRLRVPDGAHILWTVADGSRGRRWRSSTTRADALVGTLLLELAPDGRLGRLELATAAGLLTLHPDHGGERIQGNLAGPAGVRHLELAWGPGHVLLVSGSPIVAAAAIRQVTAHRPATADGVGEGTLPRPAILVGDDLAPRLVVARFERLAERSWTITVRGLEERIEVDSRGVPTFEGTSKEWALEREHGGGL